MIYHHDFDNKRLIEDFEKLIESPQFALKATSQLDLIEHTKNIKVCFFISNNSSDNLKLNETNCLRLMKKL